SAGVAVAALGAALVPLDALRLPELEHPAMATMATPTSTADRTTPDRSGASWTGGSPLQAPDHGWPLGIETRLRRRTQTSPQRRRRIMTASERQRLIAR